MKRQVAQGALAVLLSILWAAVSLQAQDFQKTYALPGGGQIRVSNISGDITVAGYDGDSVVVTALKTGRDRDRVSIEDASAGGLIDLKVRYPEHGSGEASVEFDVKVPRAVRYVIEKLNSVSGDIAVTGVTAQVRASTVSGDVNVTDVIGIVSASSVSGSVTAEMKRLDGNGDMKFTSVSGNVSVRAPANLDADIHMATVSGSLKTDFPIEVSEPRYGPGRSARGRLGAGTRNLHISSVSGRVSLVRM